MRGIGGGESIIRLNLKRALHVADKYPASRVEICRSDCDHRVRHLEEVLFAQFHIPRRLRTTHPHMTHRHIAIRTQMSAEPDLALRNLRSELAEFVT